MVGGGLQGLVVLRELTSAGYGCVLVTDADLERPDASLARLAEQRHRPLTGALLRELHELTLPYLRRVGVPFYGEDRSFLLAPDVVVDQLRPAWEANQYRPERIGQVLSVL